MLLHDQFHHFSGCGIGKLDEVCWYLVLHAVFYLSIDALTMAVQVGFFNQ